MVFKIWIVTCIAICILNSFSTSLNLLDETTYYSYPGNCNLYYERRALNCAPNSYWSDKLQRCDNLNYSECSTPIVNPSTDNDNLNLVNLCANQMGKLIPYPGNCSLFIQCDYIPFVKICPKYLYWNSKLLTCDRICV